jgi:hypothetical protein
MGGMIEQLRALGLDVPAETQNSGLGGMMNQPQEPQEDPMEMFQRTMAENAPLIAASRNAALLTPDKREEEIYKDKIRQMFGVKLGEKNPKWRSGLRGIVEGLDSLAAGYNRTPTIREKARKQAEADYKLENEVLGKDSTATLARMGQAAQQANLANIAKMKTEALKINQQAKLDAAKDPNNPKVQEIAAKIAESATRGDLNAAKTYKLQLDGELVKKKTELAGTPPLIQTLKALRGDPELAKFEAERDANKAVGSAAARALFGAGGQGSTTVSEKLVPNEQTGRMERETTTSTRTPNAVTNRGTAAEALTRLGAKLPGTEASPGAPVQSGAAPDNSNAAPVVSESKIVVPRATGSNPASKAISAQERSVANIPPAQVARMTPTAGKKYYDLQNMSNTMKRINETMFGAGTTFDAKGQSVGDRYTGVGGTLLNMLDRASGDQNTNAAMFKEANDQAFNLHRHFITGAGAGWKELDFLKDRFPSWMTPWTADNFDTSLQKALILHYTMQKQLWNFEKAGLAPETLGKIFDGDKMVQRVDEILGKYKELRAKIPTAPTDQRKKLVSQFQSLLKEKLDGRDMFDSALAQAQGKIPGTAPVAPPQPARKRIRIEVQ